MLRENLIKHVRVVNVWSDQLVHHTIFIQIIPVIFFSKLITQQFLLHISVARSVAVIWNLLYGEIDSFSLTLDSYKCMPVDQAMFHVVRITAL